MSEALTSLACRHMGAQLSAEAFRSTACAQCLSFIYLITLPFSAILHTQLCPNGLLICPSRDDEPHLCTCSNPSRVFNVPEFALNRSAVTPLEELRLKPPLPDFFPFFTKQCCEAAWDCCQKTQQSRAPNIACPGTWDGWQCFGDSQPGTIEGRCPTYIYGNQKTQFESYEGLIAVKQCTPSGWAMRAETGQEWTDYVGCRIDDESARIKVLAGIIPLVISAIALIPALLILTCFRSLKHQSVFIIHRHLLLSFLLFGVSYLLNFVLFIFDGAPLDHQHTTNHIICRVAFSVQLRFFRLSTFSWMLAEGVYLFRLLRNAFSDESSLMPYKIICWGVPLLITIVYGILRQLFDNEGCWISPSLYHWIEWVYMAPCLVALCTNLLLVTLILYILVKKLRYNPHLEPVQYRKAVRAALMLVPVFGLHFLFTIYRIPSHAHQIINMILDGLQGFAVSIILCYANRSAMECVKKWVGGKRESRKLKEEHKKAVRRCESARSAHKNYETFRTNVHAKSLAESTTLVGALTNGGISLVPDSPDPVPSELPRDSADLRSPLVSKL
ncbi:unnamed protein product, partial [Mesorhabditis belari]|uniref:Calcitonin receptor n=1 Tax=Mesorhabditis belari TaxID=2138241 RepID=A0AAF3EBH4_9BILA